MTPEETRHAAQVMLAHAQGKRIQWQTRQNTDGFWNDTEIPRWDWCKLEYRVAPERWSGKIWVHPDGSYMTPATAMGEGRLVAAGWRLIEAKEVEP